MSKKRKSPPIHNLMAVIAAAGVLATPLHAFAATNQQCEDLLKATATAADDAGMTIKLHSSTAVQASSDAATMDVSCDSTYSTITVEDMRGGVTTIESDTSGELAYTVITSKFNSGAYISKEYSFSEKAKGEQVHFAANSDGDSAQLSGSFTPETLEGDQLRIDFGDPGAVNAGYSGIEFRAEHWLTALELQFAWSGLAMALDNEGATAAETDLILESMTTLPIPAQAATQDSDRTNTNRVCTAGAAACIGGLLGVIGAGACALGGVACLAAGICQAADCSGDG